MGALGSDAAIEAADIVLMDDEPLALVDAVQYCKGELKVSGRTRFIAGSY